MKHKPGAPCRDNLHSRLAKLKVKGELTLPNENQRNRALKYARNNRMIFVTRTLLDGKIVLWRQS
jgi:hypothetical protein